MSQKKDHFTAQRNQFLYRISSKRGVVVKGSNYPLTEVRKFVTFNFHNLSNKNYCFINFCHPKKNSFTAQRIQFLYRSSPKGGVVVKGSNDPLTVVRKFVTLNFHNLINKNYLFNHFCHKNLILLCREPNFYSAVAQKGAWL